MLALLKRYFTVINLVILSTGIFFITHIISFNIGKILEPPISVKAIKDTAGSGNKKLLSFDAYKSIIERNIFNSKRLTEDNPLPVRGVLNSLKVVEDASIPIKLIGTVAGTPSYAYAIIEDPFQRGEKIFRVDDTIAPGVKLAEIYRNMIVITRDGVREEIRHATEEWYLKMARQLRQSAVDLFSPEGGPVSSTSPERNNSGSVGVAQGDYNNKDGSIQLSKGMSRLLTQAQLVQQIAGGESEGFMIHSIESDSLYARIGLEDGDVIAGINGLDLKEPRDASDIYQTLKNEDFFIIDFNRNGNKMTLTSLDSDVLALLVYLNRTGF